MVGWEKAPGNIWGIQRAPAAAALLTRQLWEKIEILFVIIHTATMTIVLVVQALQEKSMELVA